MNEVPLTNFVERVRAEWAVAGHVDVAAFALVFDHATDALREHLGLGWQYAEATQRGIVVAEAHCTYLREARVGDLLRVHTWLLGVAAKRMHVFHEMRRDEDASLVATSELMLVHVDRALGRSIPFAPQPLARMETLAQQHTSGPLPAQVGRSISLASDKQTGFHPGATQ